MARNKQEQDTERRSTFIAQLIAEDLMTDADRAVAAQEQLESARSRRNIARLHCHLAYHQASAARERKSIAFQSTNWKKDSRAYDAQDAVQSVRCLELFEAIDTYLCHPPTTKAHARDLPRELDRWLAAVAGCVSAVAIMREREPRWDRQIGEHAARFGLTLKGGKLA